jgi:hypothetical protein
LRTRRTAFRKYAQKARIARSNVDGGAGSRTGLRRYGELSNDRYIIATPILFGLHHHYARI